MQHRPAYNGVTPFALGSGVPSIIHDSTTDPVAGVAVSVTLLPETTDTLGEIEPETIARRRYAGANGEYLRTTYRHKTYHNICVCYDINQRITINTIAFGVEYAINCPLINDIP